MGVKHKNLGTADDGVADGRVQPSWWREDHDIGDFLSALFSLAVTPSTFPYIKPDGTAGASQISDFARIAMGSASPAEFASALGAAPLDSPTFTGMPHVPNVTNPVDRSQVIANTAFVQSVADALLQYLAPRNSPALTGAPTAPTPSLGDNSLRIANMAAVQAAIAALVATAPSTLDTLNELAVALGNDPNFATTMTALIGTKAAKGANSDITALSNLTGGITLPSSGAAVNFSSNSRHYDAIGAGHIAISANDSFTIYNAAASAVIAQLASSVCKLPQMPQVAGNFLLQMLRGVNGYVRFWDGTGFCLIQWGNASFGSADGTVNLPVAFPNNCRQVLACPAGATAGSTLVACSVGTKTLTGFDVYGRFISGGSASVTTTTNVSWVALGD